MNNRINHKPGQRTLGDLIQAVRSVSENDDETVAAVADLLQSGRVHLGTRGRRIRARVEWR